jgi:hypothetical protein
MKPASRRPARRPPDTSGSAASDPGSASGIALTVGGAHRRRRAARARAPSLLVDAEVSPAFMGGGSPRSPPSMRLATRAVVLRLGASLSRRLPGASSASGAELRFARAAVVPVLLTGCWRGGQRERAALRVPAHGPAIAGMDDRAAELADAVEGRGHVGDGEVGQGGCVAGAWSTLVDSEAQVVGVGLPPGSGRGGSWRKGYPKDSVPEPAGAIGIVGRKLDQRRGHGREYDRRSRALVLRATSRSACGDWCVASAASARLGVAPELRCGDHVSRWRHSFAVQGLGCGDAAWRTPISLS